MPFCKQCKKWFPEGTGKRKKEFCNETCRSNFWYAKNKKGKESLVQYKKPTEKDYDGAKINDYELLDEPLSFDKLRQQITSKPFTQHKTVQQYMKWKREIDSEEEYQQLLADVEANPILTRKEKEFCKTANPSQL